MIHMNSLVLKTITPLFLGGADAARMAEFRIPSIKGQLRFWYRATDPEYRHHESRLFGSTEAGQSSFLVMLASGQPAASFIQAAGESWGRTSELGYLGFGPVLRDNFRREFLTQRPYVKPDFAFTVRLLLAPWLSELDDRTRIIRAVKSWTLFGGLGARSRRGFGSLQVEKLGTEWAGPPADIVSLEARCRECLDLVDPKGTLPGHTAFSSQSVIKLVPIPNNPSDWRQALAWVGQRLSRFRSCYGNNNERFRLDHDLFYDVIQGNDPGRCPERHVFGLPHNYFTPKMGRRKMEVTAERVTGHRPDHSEIKESIERRGSPLFIRVHQLADKSFVLLLAFLPARVLPQGSRLVMQADNGEEFRSDLPLVPNWAPIADFLEHVGQQVGTRTIRLTNP